MTLHPSQEAILRFFEYEHLPPDLADIAQYFYATAHLMAEQLADTPHGAELTTGLRKLLEAKDCMVRAAIR